MLVDDVNCMLVGTGVDSSHEEIAISSGVCFYKINR